MSGRIDDYKETYFCKVLSKNEALIENTLSGDSLLRKKQLTTPFLNGVVFYIDGMVDSEQLNDAVIKPLLTAKDTSNIESKIIASDVKSETVLSKVLDSVLYGGAAVFIDGIAACYCVDIKYFRIRSIGEPENEKVLKGPREGFCEAVLTNISLIRRRLKAPDLCTQKLTVGDRSHTNVYICYLESLVDKSVLEYVKSEISDICIDGILDTNYIAELCFGDTEIFPTTGNTERPDTVCASLLEGRIAVLVDGTPSVMTVPYLFSENFESDEDYYISPVSASLGRLLRYMCFSLSLLVPSVFIAISTYHPQLLPTALTVTVARLRSGIPFSAFGECLIMIFIFEILGQAGLRMPKNLGHALSIVGGLVVGETAVEAGIVSTPMLIAVAVSGISGLMVPRLSSAVSFFRIAFVFAAAFFGLYGLFAMIFCVLIKILSINSVNIDATLQLKSVTLQGLKDTLLRFKRGDMLTRPLFCDNKTRMTKGERK